MPKSDQELVELSKKNPDNFSEIVNRYWTRLFFFIKRISYFSNEDIEDILQESFIKTYKNLNGYNSEMTFSTWIYQITRNTVIDEIRKKNCRVKTVQLENQELAELFSGSLDIKKEVIAKESFEKIKEIIQSLPYKYREVLILRFLEEKSYEEIIDIVKKPKGTVAALINRGRKMLLEEAQEQNII